MKICKILDVNIFKPKGMKFKFWINSFLKWYLNLSLYWKVGFLIGCCFFINFFIALSFYFIFNHAVNLQIKIPYEYELLTTKALTYLEKKSAFDFKLRTDLEKVLKDLDPAKEHYPEINPSLEKIENIVFSPVQRNNPEVLASLNEEFSKLNQFFKNHRYIFEKKLELYKKIFKYLGVLLLLTMFAFLAWGSIAFYYMVKRPLDSIIDRLDFLTREEETNPELKDLGICVLEYGAKDEIGKVIAKVNEILNEFNTLKLFKRTIENDETSELVWERLGYYLRDWIGLDKFIIYEVSNSQNTMQPVYMSQPAIEYTSEILFNADKCRAKRTGQIVTSLTLPNICKLFPNDTEFEYYCIPMIYGGKCIGVVSIHLSKLEIIEKPQTIEKKLKKINSFIKEAIPVIEAKRYAEALKEQTYRDALTGLYNRHFLEAILENLTAQIIRRETILGILMCDLDYFKSVNDKYGHNVGDMVLRETARLLASNVRKSDLAIRFGGEEFLIFLVDVKEGESVKVAEKLRHIIETYEFKTPQGVIKKTISIGVSEFPIDTPAIWEAIKFADVALYKAKEQGRNRVVRFKRKFWTHEEY